MTTAELSELLITLRGAGVVEYRQGDVYVRFGRVEPGSDADEQSESDRPVSDLDMLLRSSNSPLAGELKARAVAARGKAT